MAKAIPISVLKLHTRSLCRWLYGVILLLSCIHIAVLIAYYIIDDTDQFDFVRIIDFDYESNIPTLFSSLLFFIVTAFLLLIRASCAVHSDTRVNKDQWYWLGMAIVFLFLGFDEGLKLHEYVGDFTERFVDASGFLYFPWFIPYMLIFIVLSAFYLPFYLRLPNVIKMQFFISAVIYLCGAVGLDILSANEADMNGTTTIYYSVVYTIEEIMEMVGLVLFIQALTNYLAIEKVSISFVAAR